MDCPVTVTDWVVVAVFEKVLLMVPFGPVTEQLVTPDALQESVVLLPFCTRVGEAVMYADWFDDAVPMHALEDSTHLPLVAFGSAVQVYEQLCVPSVCDVPRMQIPVTGLLLTTCNPEI